MKAVLLPGSRRVEVVERPDPVPAAGEVLVRVRASALCRSDMSLYDGTPVVGGEAAGTGVSCLAMRQRVRSQRSDQRSLVLQSETGSRSISHSAVACADGACGGSGCCVRPGDAWASISMAATPSTWWCPR